MTTAEPTPSSPKKKPTLRPLRVRRGVRYTCVGDGLCCTDLHGLGPLTKKEVRSLSLISEGVVVPADESDFEEPMLRTRDDGGCLFLGESRCDLHASLGPDAKPAGCRRFPLGLSATPSGGRITTRHRCPCRTLGDRPALTAEAALPSLLNRRGEPTADRRIGRKIALTDDEKVPFDAWEEIEAALLDRLEAGEDPALILDAEPFPSLRGSTWKKAAREMLRDGADATRFGRALGWFASTILSLTGAEWLEVRPLGWDGAFDRAEARSPVAGSGDRIVADWIEDEIWALEWAELGGTFARARSDLATRLAVAQDMRARLVGEGRREDRAAAEAVAIVDLVADSEWWEDVVATMKV